MKTTVRLFFTLSMFVLPVFTVLALPSTAHAFEVDLSKPDVRLTVSFKGVDLLLFGTKDKNADVIVVVRGPDENIPVRLKKRVAGIWVNVKKVVFKKVPTFYALASNRPLKDILPSAVLAREKIGESFLDVKVKSAPRDATADVITNFTAGLVRNMTRMGLYTAKTGKINLVGKQLFRTNLWFPSNVRVGKYVIYTYLVVNQKIKEKKTTALQVHKVSFEAQIYNFAHKYALIYGLLAIVIAVVSGWIANSIFKKKG